MKYIFREINKSATVILNIVKVYSKSSLQRPGAFTFDPVNMVFVCEQEGKGGRGQQNANGKRLNPKAAWSIYL